MRKRAQQNPYAAAVQRLRALQGMQGNKYIKWDPRTRTLSGYTVDPRTGRIVSRMSVASNRVPTFLRNVNRPIELKPTTPAARSVPAQAAQVQQQKQVPQVRGGTGVVPFVQNAARNVGRAVRGIYDLMRTNAEIQRLQQGGSPPPVTTTQQTAAPAKTTVQPVIPSVGQLINPWLSAIPTQQILQQSAMVPVGLMTNPLLAGLPVQQLRRAQYEQRKARMQEIAKRRALRKYVLRPMAALRLHSYSPNNVEALRRLMKGEPIKTYVTGPGGATSGTSYATNDVYLTDRNIIPEKADYITATRYARALWRVPEIRQKLAPFGIHSAEDLTRELIKAAPKPAKMMPKIDKLRGMLLAHLKDQFGYHNFYQYLKATNAIGKGKGKVFDPVQLADFAAHRALVFGEDPEQVIATIINKYRKEYPEAKDYLQFPQEPFAWRPNEWGVTAGE